MGKLNCWNFKNCGRYPGGPKAGELGVCPAATLDAADGYLGGRSAGRACAYVTGTFCGGTIQGTVEDKEKNCQKCDYYKALKKTFGRKLSVAEFTTYARQESGKLRTDESQAWTDPDRSPAEIAEEAKRRYC